MILLNLALIALLNFAPSCYPFHAVRCYDGDTCRGNVELGLGVWAHDTAVRLEGINAPELRGTEKEQGRIARDYLRGLLYRDGAAVRLCTTGKTGKYGRVIGRIFADGQDTSEAMLRAGMAEDY